MYIAIDIGGTNTRIATFENAQLKKQVSFKTFKNDFDLEIKEIAKIINNFKLDGKISGIGISAPGPANFKTGLIGNTPNLPDWRNKNLIVAIKEVTGVENIKMENDANLMALAHHYFFKNNGKITQFFTISTGLGAGLIIDDKVFTGNSGHAQEVAYAPMSWIKEDGKDLTVGALELFSSGSGIAYRAQTDTPTVFKNYDNNETYKKIIDDGIETLANLIAITLAIIDPAMIVFDGPVARHNRWYVEKALELAKNRSYKGQLDNIKIKYGELGDNAGLYGAFRLIYKGD